MAEDTDNESVLDSVRAAAASLEETQAPEPVQAEPIEAEEPAEPAGTRARNPDGTFAAKDPDEAKEPKRPTLTLKEKPQEAAATAAPSVPPTPQQAATPAASEKILAPQEWSGLAKVKWDRLPADVQREIAQHEQMRSQTVAELAPVREMLDVNREFLVNNAGSLPNAMQQLMQFARMSVDNPVALAEHILRSKGIDPRAAFAGQPQAPQQGQPDGFQSLQQEVRQLREENQRQQQLREQQEIQQLQNTISQFGSDPKRPFFNDVRQHMGQLIGAGLATSLDEAYDKACKLHPAISTHLETEAREAAEKAKAAEVQKAQAARRATVTGSPLPGAIGLNGKSDPKASALDDVRAAYNELAGG